MKRIFTLLLLLGLTACGRTTVTVVKPLPGEKWWGSHGFTVPFLVSSKGRYIWSDRPFSFEVKQGTVKIYSNDNVEVAK